MRRSGYLVAVILVLLLINVLQYSAGDEDRISGSYQSDVSRGAVRDPEISMRMKYDVFEAEVELGIDDYAMVRAEVSCIMPPEAAPLQYVIVELTTYCEGWDTLNPSTLVFGKDTEVQLYNFSVKVDSIQKAGDYNVSIAGTWYYSPGTSGGSIDPAYGIIRVLPYGAMSCGRRSINLTADVGEWVSNVITIRNKGNSKCSVDLSFIDIPPNVEYKLNQEVIEFSCYGQATLEIWLRQDGGSGESHSFKLTGKNSVPGESADFTIYVSFKSEDDAVSPDLLTGFTILFMSMAGVLVIIFIIVILVKILKRDRE